MNSIINALYELKYNPFVYGAYFASFFTTIGKSENNLLLAPLVIPLCSHPVFGKKLYYSNVKSTIWSIFDDRTKLYDLQERIDEFQEITAQCIEYCLINDWLSIDEDSCSLSAPDGYHSVFTNKKSAEKLGRLYSGHSVVEIYAFLGVDFPGFRRQMIYIVESTGEVHVQAPVYGRIQVRSRQASH